MRLDASELNTFLLVGAAVTLFAIAAVRLSTRAGLPSLLIYLFIGVLLGDSVLGIRFDDADLTHALGFAALALILAEGGLTTSWGAVRPSLPLGVVLATVGVGVSVAVMALAGHYLLGLGWQLSVLLGAVTSPTDAAAVFSVLRRVPLPERLSATLEAESGLNDAPTIVLVTLVSTSAATDLGVPAMAGLMVVQLVGGVAVGLGVGFGGSVLMRQAALPASGLYPVAALSLAMLAYAGASTIDASGFAAVYVAALVLGNTHLPHGQAIRSFAEGFAWMAQIGLFVLLGLLASPARIDLGTVVAAVAAAGLLTLVARPVSVAVCGWVGRLDWRESAFLSWAGLRGAVPIVLATIPLAEKVDGAERLFDLVFVLVVALTLLTAPTLPAAARLLKVTRRSEPRGLDVEAAPLDRVDADLLQITISPRSLLHGVEVGELRLPPGVSVSLVIRSGETMVPEWRTVLRHGDELLVVTPRSLRRRTEQRLRLVSSAGRLAGWRGPDPGARATD